MNAPGRRRREQLPDHEASTDERNPLTVPERPTPLNCASAMAEMDAFLCGELTVAMVDLMRAHLDACAGCRQAAAYERAFRTRLLVAGSSVSCPPALRERIKAMLAEGHAPG